jgi:DNA-binding PadR family transcriptional regulator
VTSTETLRSKFESELKRGSAMLAVLCHLREPQYGYSLRQALVEGGMPMEEGTLYPLLRRLEGQGILASEWQVSDGPPRRYYQLSPAGRQLLIELTQAWHSLAASMDKILKESGNGSD